MSALNPTPRAEFQVKTGELVTSRVSPSGVQAQIWRMYDWFDVGLYAVVVNGEVIRELDTEHDARMWIIRNI